MAEIMRQIFLDKVKEQYRVNTEKYGEQDTDKLLLVCQEQLGHLVRQYLNHGIGQEALIEIIHLAAVLYDLCGR